MAVITVSRLYGSGGTAIARRVAEILGYSYFDKRLMAEVASEMGVSENQVVDFSEDTYKMRSFVERVLGIGSSRVQMETLRENENGGRTFEVETLNEVKSIDFVRDTIRSAYERGNVVIVGRGGQAVLKEEPGVLHVRIEATLGARVMWLKDRLNISLGEAENLANRRDQSGEAYLRRFYDIDWSNPMHYHMVLNTCKWEKEAAAQILAHAVSQLPYARL